MTKKLSKLDDADCSPSQKKNRKLLIQFDFSSLKIYVALNKKPNH